MTNRDAGKVVRDTLDATNTWLFPQAHGTTIAGIRIIDVGQGDCIGLLDQRGYVFAYIDYGGYVGHPERTSPGSTPFRMPVSGPQGKVAIILTHWDLDHIFSAHSYNIQAQDCRWLVPRQWVSPFAARLAAKLKNAKCWPEKSGSTARQFRFANGYILEIRKCAPIPKTRKEDRNLTGLAVTLLEVRNGTIKRQMVLPGDCPFDRISNLSSAPIRHLVAYHHGSRNHWIAQTAAILRQAAPKRSLSYSFSPLNTYGHPDRTKYRFNWGHVAEETPDLRKKGLNHRDIRW